MDVVSSSFMPGDPRLIDQIVYELKSQGIFDQFRKECIADVDTKPAYQNLRQRVEGNVTSFLAKQKWSEDLNKNQLREQLRKHISEAGWLEKGVERIVDQVVNPKINSIFLPKVEDVYHSFLGIEKPLKLEDLKEENIEKSDDQNKPGTSGGSDLLPNDLEAISPESNKDANPNVSGEKASETINIDEKSQDSSSNTLKTEDEESPPFEPLDDISENSSKFSPKDENSVDSQVSGLMSHDSSIEKKPSTPVDISQEISQNSTDTKTSSNGSTKMEISENEETNDENEKMKSADKKQKSDKDHDKLKSDVKEKKNEGTKVSEKEKDRKSKHDKDKSDEKPLKDSSHSRDRSSSKHSQRSSRDKEKRDVKDKKEHKRDDSSISKDRNRDKDRSRDKIHKEKDSKSSKEKSDKEKNRISTEKLDKDKSSKDKEGSRKDDKDKHKSTSSRDKESERVKDKDKHKLVKEKSSSKESSSENRESSKKHQSEKTRDRESSSSKEKSKEKDRNKDKSRSSKDSNKSSKDKLKDSSRDHKDSSRDHKDKNAGNERSKSSDKHKKTEQKKKSPSQKEKDKKSKDDHYSSKEKRNERRSTDRDSNDGSGKMSRNSSFNECNSQSSRLNKSSSRKLFDSSTSGDSSGGNSDKIEAHSDEPVEYIEEMEVVEHELVEHEFVQCTEVIRETVMDDTEEIVGEVAIVQEPQFAGTNSGIVVPTPDSNEFINPSPPSIKYIKPKFASNMKEAMRIMKIRKQLAELEKQANSTLQNLSGNKKHKEKEEEKSPKEVTAENTAIASTENDISSNNIEATSAPSIKFIKPKFASNIQEAMRLMKIRKKLAKLEKEHQQALSELTKRKENLATSSEIVGNVMVTACTNEKQSDTTPISLSTVDEGGKISKIELTDDEPLLQSFDLSSERFAELEARLALEMANIDFSSYDIPSDEEEEEYQSIVISPKKDKTETRISEGKFDVSKVDETSKKSLTFKKEKLPRKNHVVKKDNKNKNIIVKNTSINEPIKKAKNNKKQNNHVDNKIKVEKLNPNKKKLIIISCKQNLCNGFAEEDTEEVPDSPMFKGFENVGTTNNKGTNSSEKENSTFDILSEERIQSVKRNLSKVLFIKMSESDKEKVRRASLEIVENTPNIYELSEVSRTCQSSGVVKNSPIPEEVDKMETAQIAIDKTRENNEIPQNKCIKNSGNIHTDSYSDLWEPENTPCFYFLPPTESSEKHFNVLTDFVRELENTIEKQSDDIPKKKVGRKRKIENAGHNNQINVNSPDAKRKRHDSLDHKNVNNLLLNDETQNLGFSLPLSPAESEVDMKKEEPLIVPIKRRSDRASMTKRYDNSDLYKPRPVISRGSSRRSLAQNVQKS